MLSYLCGQNSEGGKDVIPYWELSVKLLRDVAFLSNESKVSDGDETKNEDRIKLMGRYVFNVNLEYLKFIGDNDLATD